MELGGQQERRRQIARTTGAIRALQDRGRATLIGETSYGKGTVQQWQELTGNGGAFKLTVARWLTPNGHSIHQKGLTPDIPVTVGAQIPPVTELYALPDSVTTGVPSAKFYRYTIAQSQVIIVDPTNMKVVDVIRP